jgi:hypothetical protein
MGASARTPVVAVAGVVLLLAVLSLILPSTATYDPWAWIIWGRETIHGDLNTIDGPSWKPLPVVVTSVGALFGSAAPAIWIVAARAGALGAIAVAYALGRRIAGPLAGVLSAVPLALAPWFFWHGWLANSEGLLVAFVLAAVLAEIHGRHRTAMACGVAAGLLRPEAWPFLLLLAAWLAWHAGLRGRVGVLLALAILPPAWLLPERWGSGDFWRASTRAQNPDPGAPALTAHPWFTILRNFVHMVPATTWVAAVVAVVVLAALAARGTGRRAAEPRRTAPPTLPGGPWAAVAVLAGLGLAWLVLVAIMTERGYSGNERYLIQPVAFVVVAAGAAAGLALARLPRAAGRAALATFAVVAVAVGVAQLPEEARSVAYEGHLVHDLPVAIEAAGGAARLKACGNVSTLNLMVPQVAWQLRMHAVAVKDAKYTRTPVVLRLRLTKGDALRPSVGRVPSMPVLARTRYWQIEAQNCPPITGVTR